jgi:aminoglycoside phosphotransferase (APT) family kinase protein
VSRPCGKRKDFCSVERALITPPLVSKLVASQFPQWAHLPVREVDLDGWDNTTFRLGDELSVRLPSADGYVPQVEKEHRWLPVLAPQLPRAIPRPVAKGVPGPEFPRPWSIYGWLPGQVATVERIADPTGFARDLADFLAALYAVDPSGGRPAGAHSFFRGGPLSTYDADARAAISALDGEIDAAASTAAWEAALAARWDSPPVWVHGDVTAANLLVVDGRLSAVIDFGCCAVGDPACDVAIAWTFFQGDSRDAFRERLCVNDATWARGRGWALWKAAITLASARRTDPGAADRAAARFGWRVGARAVIDEVLADA